MARVRMIKRNIYGKSEIKCRECGKIVQEAEKILRLNMPYCGSCDKRIEDATQAYCGHCGEKLDWT